jgi:hypothetical protein
MTNPNLADHAKRNRQSPKSHVAGKRQFPMPSDYRKNHTHRIGIADALSTEIDMAIKGKLRVSRIASGVVICTPIGCR